MQSHGIKIRFTSGCSAGVARCVRDAEAGGSNPLAHTIFFTELFHFMLFYNHNNMSQLTLNQ